MKKWANNQDFIVQWSKKNTLLPEECGVAHKVWWVCALGHEWEAMPADRIKGKGCPYCAHRLPSKEYNLAICYPHLIKEWDTISNPCSPADVLPGSLNKFWWKCQFGHRWQSSVNNRARGSGCPYCCGFYATPQNSITRFPNLVSEFHLEKNGRLDIRKITRGSTRKLWWKCVNGHEWQASPNMRTRGEGCPHCHKKHSDIEIRIWAEAKAVFGDARWSEKINGIEVDVYLPSLSLGIEVDGSYWHRNKTDKDKEKNRILAGMGVELIRLREKPLSLISENDVGCTVGEDRLMVVKRIFKKIAAIKGIDIWWYLQGTSFVAEEEYHKKTAEVQFPSKSVIDTNPELVSEWNVEKNKGITLKSFAFRSNKKVWWKCANGHEWQAVIADRTRGWGNCIHCRKSSESK